MENALTTFDLNTDQNSQLLKKSPLPVFQNSQGQWTYFQDTRMLSISTETLHSIGMSWQKTKINPLVGLILQTHKKDRESLIYNINRPKLNTPVEFRIIDKTNKSRWLKYEILQHRAGIWRGNIYDITELKQLEEKLKNAYSETESFLYSSVHNLKGPVSSILALIKIALKEVKDPLALEYLKMIDQSSERVESIIEDLMNINKIKQGNLESQRISLEEISNEAIKNLNFLKGFNEMEIIVEYRHTSSIYSDWNQIYSIYQNLIENAIKYKKPYVKGKLNITSVDIPNGIKITFSDNGSGIPTEEQDKIFNMFFRASSNKSGNGLGLYIVKNALKKIGGDIKLTSVLGKGTTFTVFLPKELKIQ